MGVMSFLYILSFSFLLIHLSDLALVCLVCFDLLGHCVIMSVQQNQALFTLP